ncbi:hypothetical protein RJ639_033716 [Escallonia herrerae]|uniref:ABC transporter domain-containing protein n=1 Tax=Escallonia herrerae TaxID=1293975 RepID=A0AA88WVH3_9ASTE|nr:hypothetical protein RJ639_033716 [Escallonia herrerae]
MDCKEAYPCAETGTSPEKDDVVLRNAGELGQYGLRLQGNGAYLTWESLSVTVSSGGKEGCKSILEGITGYARPGEVVAIMGPSGCGKSTLLDALAGRLASNTRQTGEILINGCKQQLTYGTSAYVTQEDILTWTLTVKEAVYYSAELQLPKSMSRGEKKERGEGTIREMGLQESLDTRIGGCGSKGLSGGQRRRVSICLEILTRPKLLFLDEPTSGLDSAASYYVMSQIVKLAQQYEMTVIASIHQPSSEVFGLFHNLHLLSLGRTIYFGPSDAANETIFAFSYRIILKTQNQNRYDCLFQDIEQGVQRLTTEQVIHVLAKSFKSSDAYMQTQRNISEIRRKEGGVIEKKGRQASFFTQCLILTERSFLNMNRDLGYYWLRLAIYIALAVGLGRVFYDIGFGYDSINARGSVLMFIASFLTILAIGGFPSFVEDMKVFERERLNGHYDSTAFVIGNTLSSVPFLFVTSLLPGAIAYYLAGLHKGFEHYAYFASVIFVCMMLVESLMMIVASIVPNFLMGIITGAGIQGLMILGGGFFRLPNDLPEPFWEVPVYAFQGLFKNEFQGQMYPSNDGRHKISGEYILREMWQVEMGYSKWIDLAILFGKVVLYRVMFVAIIKGVEKAKPAVRRFISPDPKQMKQVMTKTTATPLHEATLQDN